MKHLRMTSPILLLLLYALPAHSVSSGIRLAQTRVIFSAADKTQTVTVINSDDRSWLVQSRVQMTPEDGTPGPLIVTPPLFSLKSDSRQLLRILPQGGPLPADRESVFYLAVSAIPSQTGPVLPQDRLSVGVRFVVKLFYRPEKLTSSSQDVACRLVFSSDSQDVRISNPTPYYQTIGSLMFNDSPVTTDALPSMVAPYGSLRLHISGPIDRVSWQTLTDYGGLSAVCLQTLTAEHTP